MYIIFSHKANLCKIDTKLYENQLVYNVIYIDRFYKMIIIIRDCIDF